MKKHSILLIALAILLFDSCNSSHSQVAQTSLRPLEFLEKMQASPLALLIDVRTPEEFSESHLQNAKNIDWNGNDFQSEVGKLDKSKPVFIYCKSGKRSSAAAEYMRANGFKEVYELQGGIMGWRESGLPEE